MSRQSQFIAWDSQPLDVWTGKHGQGEVITLDGKQTHYLVRGQGRNIILIHGFFFDSSCWLHNIDVLAGHYRVYAIDLWGFGYSTRQPLDCSYRLFSHQILSFMDRLDIDSAVLVGQSLGGGVAVRFAVEHPDRVTRLVLVDAAGLPNPEPLTARIFMLPGVGETLFKLPVDIIRRRMLDDFFLYNPGTVTPELFQRLVWSQKIRGSISSALSIMRLRFADKLEASIKELSRIDIPVLIVWGEHDRAISSRIGVRMRDSLPGAEYEVMESSGHVPNLEQPDRFNRLLTGFLSRPDKR